MLQTSAIQTTTNQGTQVQSTSQTLGQDDFLNLLIAQLQNQDPMNPVDNTQMIAQLAQFSQLEQTKQMTTALNTFIQQQTSANATGLVSLIGRRVTANGSSLSLTPGTPTPLSYQLAGNAARVNVQVLNSSGIPVRDYALINQASGNQSLAWDGKDNNGNILPAGAYSFTVTASAANGTSVSTTTTTSGTVTGVLLNNSGTNGGPTVVLDSGQTVASTQILALQ